MPTVAIQPMIRRELGDDKICMLTFDRPESGANIFDAATMSELGDHVGAIERDNSLRGLIISSAKKSIFIAGADLKTLLKQAPTGEMRDFIAAGQRVFNRIAALKIPTVAAVVMKSRWPAIGASRRTIRPRESDCRKQRSV